MIPNEQVSDFDVNTLPFIDVTTQGEAYNNVYFGL